MTAVAVQQQHGGHRQQYNSRQSSHSSNVSSTHQSRPQSYTSSHLPRQEPPIQNGTSSPMNPRPAVSNDPVQVVNGHPPTLSDVNRRRPSSPSGRATPVAGNSGRNSSASIQARPTSAPGISGDSSPEDSGRNRRRKRPNLLIRSKSDFGPRGEDPDSETEEDVQDWGARHGFEDHYASEEYVSQLANVSCAFL